MMTKQSNISIGNNLNIWLDLNLMSFQYRKDSIRFHIEVSDVLYCGPLSQIDLDIRQARYLSKRLAYVVEFPLNYPTRNQYLHRVFEDGMGSDVFCIQTLDNTSGDNEVRIWKHRVNWDVDKQSLTIPRLYTQELNRLLQEYIAVIGKYIEDA